MTKANDAMKPVGLFATPTSMGALEDWLIAARDPMVTTAAMMMYNLLVSTHDLHPKEVNDVSVS